MPSLASYFPYKISIHALHEESDNTLHFFSTFTSYFNPRSP